MKKLLIITILAPLSGFGAFSIDFDIGNAFASGGGSVPVGSKAVIVVDKANNGFDGFSGGSTGMTNKTLNVGTIFGDGPTPDDEIIAILTAADGPGTSSGFSYAGAVSGVNQVAGTTTISIGDRFAIYFFPGITTNGATLIAGTSYGFYAGESSGSAIPTGSTTNWLVPADGTWALSAYNPTLHGEYGQTHNPALDPIDSELTAAFTVPPVVPEPSTYAAIFGLLALGVAIRRKKSLT